MGFVLSHVYGATREGTLCITLKNKAMQTSNLPQAKMWWDELFPWFYILKTASFPGLVYLLIYPPNHSYTWIFLLFFCHFTTSLLGPCHPFSERSSTHLAEDGKVQSQGNYLHKPQGRTEEVCGGVVDKQDKEDVPFCAISVVSGPRDRWQIVSLSAYKDKYVSEVRTETFRGDDRCAVKSRAAKTFEAIWCASLAAAATAVSLPTSTCMCLKCVISPSLSFNARVSIWWLGLTCLFHRSSSVCLGSPANKRVSGEKITVLAN